MKRRDKQEQESEGDSLLVGDEGGARAEEETLVTPFRKSRRTIIVEPLVFMYALAGMPVASLKSQYMYQKIASDMGIDLHNLTANGSSECIINKSDPGYIARESVQAASTEWNIYMSLVDFLPAILMTFVYGSLSDKYGRRFALTLPIIGNILTITLQLIIVHFDLPVWCFLFGVVEYFFGGFFLMITAVFAYIADTVPVEKRGRRMAIVDALILGTAAIENVIVGYMIHALGFFFPYVFCLTGKVLTLIYALCFIPETIQNREPGTSVGCAAACKELLGDLIRGIKLYLVDNGANRRLQLNLLVISYFVGEAISPLSIMTLFELNTPLCWNSVFVGFFEAASNLIKCVGMVIAAFILRKYLQEKWLVVLGIISGMCFYIYLAFVRSTVMMFFTPLFGSLRYLNIPMTRSLMSRLVNQDELGSLFAVMMVLSNTAMMVSSLSANKIYSETLFLMEGFIFLVGAGAKFLALLILFFYIYKFRNNSSIEQF